MSEIEFAVNDHFEDFIFDWNYKKYFAVGGYGSSKSYHVVSKILIKLQEEKRKCLVVREVYDTHRDSTYSLFMEVAEKMGIDTDKCFKSSPLGVKLPNGSTIIFKGMDKPAKLKSINGVSIVWLEECSEIKFEGYKELLGRLRHNELSNHLILSTNPVSESNWTYKHFFKDRQKKLVMLDDEILYKNRIVKLSDTYYHHSTCDDNFYLPKSYIDELEEMKRYDEDLYRVARQGRYGVNGTKVFPQFKEISHSEVINKIADFPKRFYKTGLDFGFVTSYNAVVAMAIDHEKKDLYIYDEYYSKGLTDDVIAVEIERFKDRLIKADSAEQKAIAYYQKLGFKMMPCKKFQGSRIAYTKKVKRFKNIYCSSNCENTIAELKDLTYKTNKLGEIIEDEFNIDPHTLSAIWYGLDDYDVVDIKKLNRRELGL